LHIFIRLAVIGKLRQFKLGSLKQQHGWPKNYAQLGTETWLGTSPGKQINWADQIYTLRWAKYMLVTLPQRIRRFLSRLHASTFHRTSVITHLLKIRIRDRWAAVSTWPEVKLQCNGLSYLSPMYQELAFSSCRSNKKRAMETTRGEFLHVPSIYTNRFHFLSRIYQYSHPVREEIHGKYWSIPLSCIHISHLKSTG
jgi:hypothetical protein